MTRPRLLDLFCGAGGAAMGYHRAGFEVVGVDIAPQPHYPFEFHQADATTWPLDGFDAIHASPPCQGYSRMRHLPWLAGKERDLLVAPLWERLADNGRPFVIENVADCWEMPSRSVLCGLMFDLPLYRHRAFGGNVLIMAPPHRKHLHVIAPGRANLNTRRTGQGGIMAVLGHSGREAIEEARTAMGIDWMTRDELTQAIPPVYTEYIGHQLMAHLGVSA